MQRVGKEGGGVIGATFGVAPASEAIVTSTKQVDIWNVCSLLRLRCRFPPPLPLT